MTNGEDEPKVNWGTASLKSGFSGVIRTSEIKKSEKSFGDKPPADQLHWVIEPTSYDEADQAKWPQAWYNISENSRSKWAKLQERLESLKCLPKRSADELIGLEFEFERIDIEFGKDRDGNKLVSEGVLMPKKLVRNTKKTKGEAGASSAPSEPASEPVAPAKEKPVDNKKMDLESFILDAIEKEPVVVTDLYKKMNKDYAISRTDVFRAMKSLINQGMAKLDSDGGVLVKVEQ